MSNYKCQIINHFIHLPSPILNNKTSVNKNNFKHNIMIINYHSNRLSKWKN